MDPRVIWGAEFESAASFIIWDDILRVSEDQIWLKVAGIRL